MKKILQSIFDFLLFSNIFMSLCAVVQGLVTYYLIGSKPTFYVAWLLFTATLGIYNFSILIVKPKHPDKSSHKRVRWFFSHYRLMATFTVVSLLSLIPLFFIVSMESRILLIFLSAISFFYSIPIFRLGQRKFGLRNIPGLKQFLITLVWTLSIVLLPILEAESHHLTNISVRDTSILIAARFLFIGALTIPFDIRDLFEDKQSGLKTVPVVWGEKKAYLFCLILLFAYILLLLLFRNGGFNADFWASTITILIAAWLIFKSKWEKNEYYYFFCVDGVLILQYLMLIVINNIVKVL